jgi:SM-20-related protein
MVERLLYFVQTQRNDLLPSGIWKGAQRRNEINLTIRRSWKIKYLGGFEDELQARARAALPEICRQLGSGRFEPSEFEVELVAHGDGAFFREHHDRVAHSSLGGRVISAVYYFHRIPKSFSGGALRIYPLAGSRRSKAFIEIEPVNDTLVFFPSWFPHEVLPVNCPSGQFEDSRFAINCWVYS